MAEASVIGQGTVVRGNVRGEGSIEIYGRVDGNVIVTGDVTLGENASVHGDVSGARVSIGGAVTGDLTGTEAVIIERAAQITGDITAPRVGIEEGARVRGALRTDEPSGSPAARSASEPRRAPRPAESRAVEPARPPVRAANPPTRKGPPAPVVPALRGAVARKKKAKPQAR
jgi:cytoskeletal protein CcmA (bactofilin family)